MRENEFVEYSYKCDVVTKRAIGTKASALVITIHFVSTVVFDVSATAANQHEHIDHRQRKE